MEFSPITIGMLAVAVLLVIFRLSISKQSPGKARDERRRGMFHGTGAGASGAFYEMLNEDKRKAIEIIIEQKAEARDPETQDDTIDPEDDDNDTRSPSRR